MFLTSARGADASYAGLGYAAFAMQTMTVGRLSGDRIVQHFGTANIIIFGGTLRQQPASSWRRWFPCLAGDACWALHGSAWAARMWCRSLFTAAGGRSDDARKCGGSGDQRYGATPASSSVRPPLVGWRTWKASRLRF